jgi:predicted HTH transcriptional regulator
MYQQTMNSNFLLTYILNLQKAFKVIYSQFLNKKFNDNESKVIDYVSTHGSITRKQVESLLHLSLSGAAKIIKKLIDKNVIETHNASRNIIYKLK